MKATSDKFQLPDGEVTKAQLKALGVIPLHEVKKLRLEVAYHVSNGTVFAVRTRTLKLPKPGIKTVKKYTLRMGKEAWCPNEPEHLHWACTEHEGWLGTELNTRWVEGDDK